MMNVAISNTSDKPIYQQLFEQLSAQIIKGELTGDYSLPPIRTAAKELRVSIITVKKAWEELERQEFIYTVTGRGCFVTNMTQDEITKKRTDIIHKQMTKDIKFYKELGLSLAEMKKLVEEYF